MYGDFETLAYRATEQQFERRREAEAFRLAQENKSSQPSLYSAMLAAVGGWMAENGERLQARYGQPAHMGVDPAC